MTAPPALRRVGPGSVAFTVLVTALVGCGWGRSIGAGSRADGDGGDAAEAGSPERVSAGVRTVERVIDGDSIEVAVDGRDVELRLEGYNAPELYADGDGVDVQTCNGLAARDAVAAAVDAASTIEVIEGGTDRFGRTLGDLVIDGGSLVDLLIAEGHGFATGDDEDRRDRMVEAAGDGLGVWGDRCGPPAVDGLSIGEVQVDAPGDDRDNLTSEYVQVVNLSSEEVELAGWQLRDDTTGHLFDLPGRLGPGERLTVVTGGRRSDSDVVGSGTLYLEEPFPVWSNEWETVVLVDPNSVFADWRFVADGVVLLE